MFVSRSNNSDNNMVCLMLLAVIFFMFVVPTMRKKDTKESFSPLDDCKKPDTFMCSPDCCGPQWPVSFDVKRDPRIKENDIGTKYVSTNLTCNGIRGAGCVCATKKQRKFLQTRGNNGCICGKK